jgi:quinoprotein glucose dehydrogenase
MPGNDYYGVNRPGNNLYDESLIAVDLKTGTRRWHYQTVHHGLWDYDLPCAPILFDVRMNGRVIKALAQPAKSAFLFVLNRETGEPIWPIEERPVPQSDVPGERTSATQPFPTKPLPFDRQGVIPDNLLDFTPELRAQALDLVKKYRVGPLFSPPSLEAPNGPLATLMLPSDSGGANWPGGSLDPETNRLYIHSHANIFALPNTPVDVSRPGPNNEAGLIPRQPGAGTPGGSEAGAGGGAPGGGRGAAGGRGSTSFPTVQGLPLVKPPYDQITAYDMSTGDVLWQKAHSSTPDDIRNNPALKGLNLPRLGQPGRTFIGTLVTKTLVIAGDGGVHTNAAGRSVALLRAYDKASGEDILGEVNMPGRQTGSPMTYMVNGRQYIVLAVTAGGQDAGGELVAYALP